jgi:hypothetical protein
MSAPLATNPEAAYIARMVLPRRHVNDPPKVPRAESVTARTRRLAHERTLIAEARAELDAGQGVSGDALEAWLDKLDGEEDLSIPAARSSP